MDGVLRMIGITKKGELVEIKQQGLTGVDFLGFIVTDQNDLHEKHHFIGCHLSEPDSVELQELILQTLHKYQNQGLLKNEQLL